MSAFKNYLVLVCSLMVTAFTVVYCGYKYVDIKFLKEANLSLEVEETSSVTATVDKNEKKEESSSSKESSEKSETVETGADLSEAVGKIYEQTISPYQAKLSYNNVYIKNTSGATINIAEELKIGSKIKIEKNKAPQVLIMHTHATECFLEEEKDFYTSFDKSRTTDNSKNITHLGEIIAEKLNKAGIVTLQDKTLHDYPSYTGSYTRSKKTVEEYLEEYPSIKIVIDLHRDSVALDGSNRARLTTLVEGKKAAQIMLCMGSETGTVTGHPDWKENLRFAMKYQQTIEALYPGLARPLLLRSSKYNQELTKGSILLEIGTESNTLKEVEYSANLAADALINLLNTMV